MELGTFLAFLAVPVLSLVFMSKIRSWGLIGYVFFIAMGALSFVMLGGLTLMMAGGYDVVQSETETAFAANGTETGSITKTTPIITDYQNIWSYVFGAFVVVFGLTYFYVMVRGGT